MNKVLFALCLLGAVAFAGTVNPTCKDGVTLRMNELYEGDTRACDYTGIKCGTYKYKPRGMWYTFTGRGRAVVLDTCDQRTAMDSVIFVFDSCDETDGYVSSCIAMDDDGCNQRQSRVMFTAESMHTYHIFVTGFLNSTGIFYLATSEVEPPYNSHCDNATQVSNFPYSVQGETGTCLVVNNPCLNTHSSGLWYKVTGSGYPLVAHTCNQNTNYDSVIAVYNACDAQEGASGCVVYNNDACYRQSIVTWTAESGSDYWIFVTGFQNARGRFTLAVEQRSMNPYSHCYEPIVITSIPYYFSGKTDYLETTYSECREEDLQHSMFFRMQGANRKVIVTTCTSSSTVNDSLIEVYSKCEPQSSSTHPGSGHTCVAYNDDYCGLGAQVVFFATSDSYYIAVSSVSPSIEGVSFSLAVMPYEETQNTQCWYAQDIDSFPDVLIGNTTGIETCEQSCDGSKTKRRGGWYRYTHYGSKRSVTASTCNGFNMLNAKIEVYNDCNEMSCVANVAPKTGESCVNATFSVENGKTYNIFVTAANANDPGGYYHVDFYEEAPSTHAKCESAYFVNRGALPYRLEDNTILAGESWSDCDNKTKNGIWVSVIGTGNKIVATTCDSHTGFDTILELYDACPVSKDEPHPEYCREVNDDSPSCNRASEIEWASESGAYYWIYVTGFASATGTFVLKIYEKVSMINAQCNTAVGIRSLPYYDFGLTTYCDMSNASCTKSARKGNWYEFVGNDHWVTISTCNEETDFATEIEVYLACSETGGEICVNHNHDYKCAPKTEITFAAIKKQLFYIFITGVDEAVMSEGFFGVSVTSGDKLPSHLSSESYEGLTAGEGFLIAVGVLMGVGVISAGIAVGYGLFKRRHVSYQEISTSG
jgi:hypothetical protein